MLPPPPQVSGIHLLDVNADVVRRWSNEVQEAVNSKSPLVQARTPLARKPRAKRSRTPTRRRRRRGGRSSTRWRSSTRSGRATGWR